MELKNPKTGEVKKIEGSWAYCLVFGCFYFLAHGMLLHTVISAGLALMTSGISWAVYPFLAADFVESHYLDQGWEYVEQANNDNNTDC